MLKLHQRSSLDGFSHNFGDVTLTEVTDKSLVSLASPMNGDKEFAAVMKNELGLTIPKIGTSEPNKKTDSRLMGMQPDQYFLLFDAAGKEPLKALPSALAKSAYLTDQSDSFVFLEVSGVRSREALERICPIDIHDQAFKLNAVARTSMEHLGTVILRTDEDTFLLISAASSADSLLHAVETSVKNIL